MECSKLRLRSFVLQLNRLGSLTGHCLRLIVSLVSYQRGESICAIDTFLGATGHCRCCLTESAVHVVQIQQLKNKSSNRGHTPKPAKTPTSVLLGGVRLAANIARSLPRITDRFESECGKEFTYIKEILSVIWYV